MTQLKALAPGGGNDCGSSGSVCKTRRSRVNDQQSVIAVLRHTEKDQYLGILSGIFGREKEEKNTFTHAHTHTLKTETKAAVVTAQKQQKNYHPVRHRCKEGVERKRRTSK